MPTPEPNGPFLAEIMELHDASVSLFVTMPILRSMLSSDTHADDLAACERTLGRLLCQLDRLVIGALPRAERRDGAMTTVIFSTLQQLRRRPASPARDLEIVSLTQEGQLFLMGAAGFALAFARGVRAYTNIEILRTVMATISQLGARLDADLSRRTGFGAPRLLAAAG